MGKKHKTGINSLKEQDTLLGYEDNDKNVYKGENSEIQKAFGLENLKHIVEGKKKNIEWFDLIIEIQSL